MARAFSRILRRQGSLQNPFQVSVRNCHREPIQVAWKKPEIGWTKLNFDASCKPGGGASIGGVFSNHNAKFLLGYAESIGSSTTNTAIAELAALRRGLELVVENGWPNVWLEGDYKILVEIIGQRRKFSSPEAQSHVSSINLIIGVLKKATGLLINLHRWSII
ncbi:uncharacterized protein LOC132281705 [Cornus florida]|uniref:uncharacterized protein LOC132281705 n=1 Tax=Cornus florida TaxID=4283 RepID=UPI0028A1709E|nr:uncharacterized protein LOC132281705 [Cornus florida]